MPELLQLLHHGKVHGGAGGWLSCCRVHGGAGGCLCLWEPTRLIPVFHALNYTGEQTPDWKQ